MTEPEPSPGLVVISRQAAGAIRLGRKSAGLSLRAAAAAARISVARWKQIEAGRRIGSAPLHTRPETLAWVAYAIRADPAELEGHPFASPEAASILREIRRREQAQSEETPTPAADLIREAGWDVPERAPDLVWMIADAPADQLSDSQKRGIIGEYARQYAPRRPRQNPGSARTA